MNKLFFISFISLLLMTACEDATAVSGGVNLSDVGNGSGEIKTNISNKAYGYTEVSFQTSADLASNDTIGAAVRYKDKDNVYFCYIGSDNGTPAMVVGSVVPLIAGSPTGGSNATSAITVASLTGGATHKVGCEVIANGVADNLNVYLDDTLITTYVFAGTIIPVGGVGFVGKDTATPVKKILLTAFSFLPAKP